MLDSIFSPSTMGTEYQHFMRKQYSSRMFLIIVIGNVLFNMVVFDASDFVLLVSKSFFANCLAIMRNLAILIPVVIWLLKKDDASTEEKQPTKSVEPEFSACSLLEGLQAAYPNFISIILGVQYYHEIASPSTLANDANYIALYGLTMIPVATYFFIRDTRIEAVLTSWGVCLVTLGLIAWKQRSLDCFYSMIAYLIITGVILFDTAKQSRRMFLLVKELQDTVKRNEVLAVEAQALELRAMIGNVAHDLKTPLTSLATGIEFLQEVMHAWKSQFPVQAVVTDDFARKCDVNFKSIFDCLNSMQGTNSFMIMTINRCLDYTKASKGFKLVPKLETVSLQAALEMPVQLMRDVQDSIEIEVLPLRAEVCVHAITDKQWLIENLLCLLSNAVKYSHKGCVQVSVKLEKSMDESSESFLLFEVQDTGVGLSDEAMQGLFNPFKQAQRLAGGTGLGLFSLANRVEALQGKYGVKHRPDGEQGSLFWFTIPFRADELSDTAGCLSRPNSGHSLKGTPTSRLRKRPDSPALTAAFLALHTESYKVLVVDDAPLIVKMTTMLLQRKGHTVHHATNGAHALEKLLVRSEDADLPETWVMPAEPLFDVVLMDLQMPVLDGIEAIRRLRAAEARRDALAAAAPASSTALSASDDTETPDLSVSPPRQFVIALSANSDEETRQEALAAGADMFLPKPFTYENFLVAATML